MRELFSAPKTLLAVIALAIVASASAQAMNNGRDAFEKDPRTAILRESLGRAEKLTAKARQRLREGKLSEAGRLASAAVAVGDDISYSYSPAHILLAEIFLHRKEPLNALTELSAVQGGTDAGVSYTKAIALAELGRNAEASAILVDAAGDIGSARGRETTIRSNTTPWRLPMDGNGSSKALVATGYLLRADRYASQETPEVLDDLLEAQRLSPTVPVVHYLLYVQLLDQNRLKEALTQLLTAKALGNAATDEFLKKKIVDLRAQITERDKVKKVGG